MAVNAMHTANMHNISLESSLNVVTFDFTGTCVL